MDRNRWCGNKCRRVHDAPTRGRSRDVHTVITLKFARSNDVRRRALPRVHGYMRLAQTAVTGTRQEECARCSLVCLSSRRMESLRIVTALFIAGFALLGECLSLRVFGAVVCLATRKFGASRHGPRGGVWRKQLS